MTHATQDEITQMAREVGLAAITPRLVAVGHDEDAGSEIGKAIHQAARAAILATLAKYAPEKMPADPDEELAAQWAMRLLHRPITVSCEDIMLGLIKHMKGETK